MTEHQAHLKFLRAVRDGEDVMGILREHDIGYGWAVANGFVSKHPAYFEFTLLPTGAEYLRQTEAA